MADKKDDAGNNKKKKSIIASLDLKNYKAKYTDIYGNGKATEVDFDNFLIAEPDSAAKSSNNKPTTKVSQPVQTTQINKPNIRQNDRAVKNTIDNNTSSVDILLNQGNKTNNVNVAANIKSANANIKTAANPITSSSNNDRVANRPKVDTNVKLNTGVRTRSNVGIANRPAARVKDEDFERRVNAEADNDFYDDRVGKDIGSTFRSTALQRNKTEGEYDVDSTSDDNVVDDYVNEMKEQRGNRKLNLRSPVKVNVRYEVPSKSDEPEIHEEPKEPPRRTETYGIVISAVAVIYGISTQDRALLFLSVSLLVYLLRSNLAAPFGKHSHSIENLLRGFSIALFLGAIFFAFF